MSYRLYAQLQPDTDSLRHLLNVQADIPQRGRRIQPERIHLTLIHFGIVSEIIKQLPCNKPTARQAVHRYVADTQHVLKTFPVQSFELRPIGFAQFGEYGRTLVIRYEMTSSIRDLHARLLRVLHVFFVNCGIEDSESFMQGDANFKHALTISPHITIAKGYDGKLPVADTLQPIRLTVMPFEYEE